MSKVTLYDLPSQPPCKTWSYNPWKTRMVLNFKGIDYNTEWVEYPDLAPTFKSLGIPPNSNDPDYTTHYTSPAIRYDDGTFAMDSKKIAHELEKRYPSPSLHLDNPIVVNFSCAKFQKPLVPHLVPKVPGKLLNERSAEYFHRTREERVGMPLSQYEKEKATEDRWEEVKEGVQELVDLLKKNGGPYILGETLSYADFIFVSFLAFLKRVDEKVFERFIAIDESIEKEYKATEKWL